METSQACMQMRDGLPRISMDALPVRCVHRDQFSVEKSQQPKNGTKANV